MVPSPILLSYPRSIIQSTIAAISQPNVLDKMTPSQEIKAQWQNPGDIFSLLLLVGGDSVQKAIARLVGVPYKLPFTKAKIYVTPVAFSFGWVAYAFMSLSSVIGESKLMVSRIGVML